MKSTLWKVSCLSAILASAPLATAFAADESQDPDTLRQQAVSRYIDGATKEVDAYRQEIDAAARPDNQQQQSLARNKLNECASLVEALKAADQSHFDVVKVRYERTRSQLVRAVQAEQRN
jgi:hypothetical protein